MITSLMDVLFGCWHSNYSFPITAKPGERKCKAALPTGTYVACLDCGKEFPYDWQEMRVMSPERQKMLEMSPVMEVATPLVSKQAA